MGKTSTIHAMAHEALAGDFKKAVLELNASDDRGLDVVRNRIRTFAECRCELPPTRHKIVILDEVDSMTEGAQQALRRIMEKYSGSTRFMLACNQSDKIIGRCFLLFFLFHLLFRADPIAVLSREVQPSERQGGLQASGGDLCDGGRRVREGGHRRDRRHGPGRHAAGKWTE